MILKLNSISDSVFTPWEKRLTNNESKNMFDFLIRSQDSSQQNPLIGPQANRESLEAKVFERALDLVIATLSHWIDKKSKKAPILLNYRIKPCEIILLSTWNSV